MTLSQADCERTEAGTIVNLPTAQFSRESVLCSLSFYFSDSGAWRRLLLPAFRGEVLGSVCLQLRSDCPRENNCHKDIEIVMTAHTCECF